MNVIVAYGDYISSFFALGFLLMNMIIAIGLPIYFWKHRGNFEAKEPQEYLGEYIEILRNNNLGSIIYHSLFILRRLFFTMIVFACEGMLFL